MKKKWLILFVIFYSCIQENSAFRDIVGKWEEVQLDEKGVPLIGEKYKAELEIKYDSQSKELLVAYIKGELRGKMVNDVRLDRDNNILKYTVIVDSANTMMFTLQILKENDMKGGLEAYYNDFKQKLFLGELELKKKVED